MCFGGGVDSHGGGQKYIHLRSLLNTSEQNNELSRQNSPVKRRKESTTAMAYGNWRAKRCAFADFVKEKLGRTPGRGEPRASGQEGLPPEAKACRDLVAGASGDGSRVQV